MAWIVVVPPRRSMSFALTESSGVGVLGAGEHPNTDRQAMARKA
jgi:hypothetical protein